MKVKVRNVTTEFEEIDLEYPIYLYFQDEMCHDELVAILDEKSSITVKFDTFGFKIECDSNYYLDKHLVSERNITTKEHFYEIYEYATKVFNSILNDNQKTRK